MYLLIRIRRYDTRNCELVSKTKKKVVSHLKEMGYYYSKKCMRYIDDKNCGISGGSGTDYLISEVDVL
jgi:hypothetical protein